MSDIWIVNTTPLIILGRLAHLHLLENLSPRVFVPNAVILEVQDGLARWPKSSGMTAAWARQYVIPDMPVPEKVALHYLGSGESQVISHCLTRSCKAILDDLAARRCAQKLGIPVIGTLGVLALAKKRGMITQVRPLVEQAMAAGLYLNKRLVEAVLTHVGEPS